MGWGGGGSGRDGKEVGLIGKGEMIREGQQLSSFPFVRGMSDLAA